MTSKVYLQNNLHHPEKRIELKAFKASTQLIKRERDEEPGTREANMSEEEKPRL